MKSIFEELDSFHTSKKPKVFRLSPETSETEDNEDITMLETEGVRDFRGDFEE